MRPHQGQRYALRISCGRRDQDSTLERGMRMMKVDPSPGLLRTSVCYLCDPRRSAGLSTAPIQALGRPGFFRAVEALRRVGSGPRVSRFRCRQASTLTLILFRDPNGHPPSFWRVLHGVVREDRDHLPETISVEDCAYPLLRVGRSISTLPFTDARADSRLLRLLR